MTQAVRGVILTPSYSFTRPADTTAYASGRLVANPTAAGSVVALSWQIGPATTGSSARRAGMIRRLRSYSTDNDIVLSSFRYHFYSANPCSTAPTGGDNAALAVQVSNASYLGAIDVTWDRIINTADAFGIGVANNGSEINFNLGPEAYLLYALMEARAAYTPASGEVITSIPEIHVY